MIIQCQACHARFRLDESKIKGKGARIRCRKCGGSIIVMKSDIPQPKMSSPAEKERFDLRAILQEPEKRPPLPPRDEAAAAFESVPDKARETEIAQPPAPEEPVVPSLKQDEIDAAFESMLGGKPETGQAPSFPAEEPAPPEEEERETFAQEPTEPAFPHDEAAADIGSPLFIEEEEHTAPVAEEPAPPEEEEREIFAQSPMEEAPPRWDEIADDLDAHLLGRRDPETYVQEPPEPTVAHDETAADIESPLFREEEEQPAPAAEEQAPQAEEKRETLVQSPMEETPPYREDIATRLDAIFHREREPEHFSQEPADHFLTRDEVDTTLENILGKERETGQETPPVAEEGKFPRAAQDIPTPLELGKEGDLSSPQQTGETPVQRREDLTGGEAHPPPSTEEGWDDPAQHASEFLNLDTALPDFLRRREAARGPGKQFDISERLSDTPVGGEGEDVAPVFPSPESTESPAHGMDTADSRADTLQDQLSDLAESTPPEETSVPDAPPPEILSTQPMENERKPAIRPRPSAPSGKPSVALLALLFVVLAGGGAYLAFTETGQQTLRTLIPSMESLWLGGKESVKPYSIGNLIGYYETGDKAGRMFVIKGVATNQGRKKKSGIRIRAELLDGSHRTIAEKTVYGGNIIAGLRSADREKIETAMANRFGDKLSNVDVAPGKSVPFMLVFFDPPEGIEEYRLEALDGD